MTLSRTAGVRLLLSLLVYAVAAPILTHLVDTSGLFGALFVIPLAIGTRQFGRRTGLWLGVVGIILNEAIWLTVGNGVAMIRQNPFDALIGLLAGAFAFSAVVITLDRFSSLTERKYRKLVELAPEGVSVMVDGKIVFANSRLLEMNGYSREEFLGMETARCLPEEDVQQGLARYSQVLQGESGTEPFAMRCRTKNGALKWVDATGRQIEWDGRPAVMYFVTDVTEKKALEARCAQAQKMEAVGRLASGVAHDFNNLLLVIRGYSNLLENHLDDRAALLRDARAISEATDQAAALTRQLLTFSRRKEVQPEITDLTNVVQQAERMLDRILGEDVRLTVSLDAEPIYVVADPSQVEEIIMNLAVNARDAMPKGGSLTIGLRNREKEAELSVADTGCGMNEETISHLFEPFFTTKEPGKGTGLGLSIIYGIVQQSGGQIRVESARGSGTRFIITLPRAEKPGPSPAPSTSASTGPGSGSILLVEDSDMVRGIVRTMLENGGYSVVEAENGEKALELCGSSQGGFNVLVTDVVMPGIGGSQLAVEIRRIHPEVQIVYMTGYDGNDFVEHGADGAVVRKPFSQPELLASVRAAFARTVA